MRDTSRFISDKYRRMLLRLSPAERLAMACRMLSTAKALAQAGIRRGHASIGESPSTRRQMFLHLYRNDFSGREVERILPSLTDGDE